MKKSWIFENIYEIFLIFPIMQNKEISDHIMIQFKQEIENILPDYAVNFENPITNGTNKHISLFPYDIERIVTLDYSLYHTGTKPNISKTIPTDIKLLITIFDDDVAKSTSSMIHLYSKLHKRNFITSHPQQYNPPQIILESSGMQVWNKLFPETNYTQSISVIISGVLLSIDDS